MWKQYKALEMSPDDRSFRWPRPTTVTTPALLLTQNVTHNVTYNVTQNVTYNVTHNVTHTAEHTMSHNMMTVQTLARQNFTG